MGAKGFVAGPGASQMQGNFAGAEFGKAEFQKAARGEGVCSAILAAGPAIR